MRPAEYYLGALVEEEEPAVECCGSIAPEDDALVLTAPLQRYQEAMDDLADVLEQPYLDCIVRVLDRELGLVRRGETLCCGWTIEPQPGVTLWVEIEIDLEA